MKRLRLGLTVGLMLLGTASAQEAFKPDTGDTAWLLVSAALVMLMTPGLAFFYGGLVRSKNALNTMMMSYVALGIVAIVWALLGYSIAFSHKDLSNLIPGFVGGLSFAFLNGVDGNSAHPQAATIPHNVFMIFQAMFAIITPALISGAIVERMKFKTYMVFIALWSLFVYAPLAHMVWSNDGFLFKLGALDFAGGTVVHISAGISALAAAIVLGPRRGFGRVAMAPHNVPFVLIGAALLWFGWFGFNAGSALGANGLAGSAFVATNFAAAGAVVAWAILEMMKGGKPTAVGAATGAVVGLVAITPAAGFVTPMSAILIGIIGASVSYGAMQLKHRLTSLDDSLDVFFCHGLGGITGAILTGVFAVSSVNPILGINEATKLPNPVGLLEGNGAQLGIQLLGILTAVALAGLGSAVLLYILKPIMGLRPDSKGEELGLDLSDHGEAAYHAGEYGSASGSSAIGSSVTVNIGKAVAGD